MCKRKETKLLLLGLHNIGTRGEVISNTILMLSKIILNYFYIYLIIELTDSSSHTFVTRSVPSSISETISGYSTYTMRVKCKFHSYNFLHSFYNLLKLDVSYCCLYMEREREREFIGMTKYKTVSINFSVQLTFIDISFFNHRKLKLLK